MRKLLMSWVPGTKRWAKNYKGRNYAVSCRQLGVPDTKEGSWRAANAWWTRKQAEVDAALGVVQPHPHQAALNELDEKIDWAATHAPAEVPALVVVRQEATSTPAGLDTPMEDLRSVYQRMKDFERESGISLDGVDISILQKFFGQGAVWQDRLERQPAGVVASDKTLRVQADNFLASLKLKYRSKPGTYGEIATHVNYFVNCKGVANARMPVDAINEVLVQRYHTHLATKVADGDLSEERMKNRWLAFQRLVTYLWEMRLVEMPRNLRSLKVRVRTQKVQVPEMAAVREVLDKVTGRLRLYLLLMLNCGMYQVDIASLRQEEVDWEKGYITRKRTKTEDKKNVPTVTYQLWDETFSLLKEYRSDKPWVLVSERGTVLVERMLKGDKAGKKDLIQLLWKRWRKETGITTKLQLKQLRKVGATLLETHRDYGRYVQHWLGQAPNSIAAKHYVSPSQELFDEAVSWLRTQVLGS